jgi:hypothetical protein
MKLKHGMFVLEKTSSNLTDRPTDGQSGLAGHEWPSWVTSEDRSRWATEAEDVVESEDMEDLLRAKVNCKECELTTML